MKIISLFIIIATFMLCSCHTQTPQTFDDANKISVMSSRIQDYPLELLFGLDHPSTEMKLTESADIKSLLDLVYEILEPADALNINSAAPGMLFGLDFISNEIPISIQGTNGYVISLIQKVNESYITDYYQSNAEDFQRICDLWDKLNEQQK